MTPIEPTMRQIRPVALEPDGSVVWEDVDTGLRWTEGEQPTAEERRALTHSESCETATTLDSGHERCQCQCHDGGERGA